MVRAVLAVLLLLAACDVTGPVSPPPAQQNRTVIYEISGTAAAVSVTLSNAQGGTEQGQYEVPFRRSFQMPVGSFSYVSAQNLGTSGSVTCRILVDGDEFRTSTSQGAHVIASCDGAVP